jgi:hypothetical protein
MAMAVSSLGIRSGLATDVSASPRSALRKHYSAWLAYPARQKLSFSISGCTGCSSGWRSSVSSCYGSSRRLTIHSSGRPTAYRFQTTAAARPPLNSGVRPHLNTLRASTIFGLIFSIVVSAACTTTPRQFPRVSAYIFVVCWKPISAPDLLTSKCGDQLQADIAEKECGGPAPAQLIPVDPEVPFVESAKVEALKKCMAARGWAPQMGPMHILEGGQPNTFKRECSLERPVAECPSTGQ